MKFQELEEYFEYIPGLLIIDMKGTVIYMTDQCAEYFGGPKESMLGKQIEEFFPETQMLENLHIDGPKLVFYNSRLGIGISMEVPLFAKGKRVGLAEYDVVQHSELLYELSDEYKFFLDRELKNLSGNLDTFDQTKYTLSDIIGQSPEMQELKRKIISIAKTNSTVIISGETGTGKELVAHAIHNLSGRRHEKFIKINASSIPENLFESELFGYEKGAFTGALNEGKKGKFELANKGTLFIDEVNQLPMSVQPKLLRALQEREIDRIGGEESIPVDVRIITATNENLEELVKQGKFREDLYYRLSVIGIKTPSLRDHLDDLEEIVSYIIEDVNIQNNLSIIGVDKEAMEILKSQPWEGNVRELGNVLESAMNFATDSIIHVEDLNMGRGTGGINLSDLSGSKNMLEQARDDAEREVIVKVLKRFDQNKTRTADYLGIARPLLYQKMKRLGIK